MFSAARRAEVQRSNAGACDNGLEIIGILRASNHQTASNHPKNDQFSRVQVSRLSRLDLMFDEKRRSVDMNPSAFASCDLRRDKTLASSGAESR